MQNVKAIFTRIILAHTYLLWYHFIYKRKLVNKLRILVHPDMQSQI